MYMEQLRFRLNAIDSEVQNCIDNGIRMMRCKNSETRNSYTATTWCIVYVSYYASGMCRGFGFEIHLKIVIKESG